MEPIEWTDQNRRELQEFLARETGQKVIAFFKQYAPIIEGKDFQSVALSAMLHEQRRRDKHILDLLTSTALEPSSRNLKGQVPRMGIDLSALDVRL